MNALTKLLLGAMGALRPLPAHGDASKTIPLPPATTHWWREFAGGSGEPAFLARVPQRSIALAAAVEPAGAANGVNRSDGGRTATSALNAKEIAIVGALPEGAYRFDSTSHALELVVRPSTWSPRAA